jgi:hypothetical protein
VVHGSRRGRSLPPESSPFDQPVPGVASRWEVSRVVSSIPSTVPDETEIVLRFTQELMKNSGRAGS